MLCPNHSLSPGQALLRSCAALIIVVLLMRHQVTPCGTIVPQQIGGPGLPFLLFRPKLIPCDAYRSSPATYDGDADAAATDVDATAAHADATAIHADAAAPNANGDGHYPNADGRECGHAWRNGHGHERGPARVCAFSHGKQFIQPVMISIYYM